MIFYDCKLSTTYHSEKQQKNMKKKFQINHQKTKTIIDPPHKYFHSINLLILSSGNNSSTLFFKSIVFCKNSSLSCFFLLILIFATAASSIKPSTSLIKSDRVEFDDRLGKSVDYVRLFR
jgi:hypothetical protein